VNNSQGGKEKNISILLERRLKEKCKGKGQAVPAQTVRVAGGCGCQILEQSAHESLDKPGNIPGTHFR
jgi:hypothetical protein